MKPNQQIIDEYNFIKRRFFPLMGKVIVAKLKVGLASLRYNLYKVLIIGYFIFSLFILFNDKSYNAEVKFVKVTETHYLPDTIKTHKDFLLKMRMLESGNRYNITNQFGYMGAYQFGRSTLERIGMGGIKKDIFLNTPLLQDICMDMLLRENKKFLEKYIGRYNSTTIKEIYVTESGILAAAHLVGPNMVILWLESKGEEDSCDANKRKCSDNVRDFSAYRLNL